MLESHKLNQGEKPVSHAALQIKMRVRIIHIFEKE